MTKTTVSVMGFKRQEALSLQKSNSLMLMIFRIKIFLRVAACTVLLPLCVAYSAKYAHADDNVYFHSLISIETIFPECEDINVRACSYPLLTTVHAQKERSNFTIVPNEALQALPPSLFNAAISRSSSPVTGSTCDVEILSEEILASEQEALSIQEERMYVSLVSQGSISCFYRSSPNVNETARIFLIWEAGEIVGWLECRYRGSQSKSCLLRLAPQGSECNSTQGSPTEISVISALDVETILKNLRVLTNQIFSRASQGNQICFPADRYQDTFRYGPGVEDAIALADGGQDGRHN